MGLRTCRQTALRPCSADLDPSFGRAWARKHTRLGPNLSKPERQSCPNSDSELRWGMGRWQAKEFIPGIGSSGVADLMEKLH